MGLVREYTGILCLSMFIVKVIGSVGKSCNATEVVSSTSCNSTEQCDTLTSTCKCLAEYVEENGMCVTPNAVSYSSLVDNQGSGSILAGILIPVCSLLLVICSIYLNKKYELVKWLRHRFSQRNRNYDEFMIGQDDDDDPPLA
ncbi:hypothetical protein GWI33_023038 [Rhynchophorus ferrugineus]|uniref:Uncharacterized protein n=1 Tax=Rhynchophorus ferrugineus TaxID=354439 RepID=A0A834HPH0_RHYFE|nr:hypothetical protein GWI33_023038 [Rhynchophorus ferrugineus]